MNEHDVYFKKKVIMRMGIAIALDLSIIVCAALAGCGSVKPEGLIAPTETQAAVQTLNAAAIASATDYASEKDIPITEFDYNINGNKEVEITGYIGDQTEAVIPSEINGMKVTSIDSFAFTDCVKLTSITIPNSVTAIGDFVFDGCTGLNEIILPNSVSSIGKYAFYDCTGLKDITIPDSVSSIGECTFYNCTGLSGITIPNSVVSIGENAFSGCMGLKVVIIPHGVASIGEGAFSNCKSLTKVTLPDSITSISKYAFADCDSLVAVSFPNSAASIDGFAFMNCKNLNMVSAPESVKFCQSSIAEQYYDGSWYPDGWYPNSWSPYSCQAEGSNGDVKIALVLYNPASVGINTLTTYSLLIFTKGDQGEYELLATNDKLVPYYHSNFNAVDVKIDSKNLIIDIGDSEPGHYEFIWSDGGFILNQCSSSSGEYLTPGMFKCNKFQDCDFSDPDSIKYDVVRTYGDDPVDNRHLILPDKVIEEKINAKLDENIAQAERDILSMPEDSSFFQSVYIYTPRLYCYENQVRKFFENEAEMRRFYTYDLTTGEQIKLKDIVDLDKLAGRLPQVAHELVDYDETESLNGVLDILPLLSKADDDSSDSPALYSYFNKDGLSLSYLESGNTVRRFSVSYDDIKDILVKDWWQDAIWAYVLPTD